MYIALAAFIALHGLAHMVGFAAPWGYMKNPPPLDSLFVNKLSLTSASMKILGIFWFAAAIVFVAAAVGLIRKEAWWTSVALVGCLLSIALSVAFLPYAKFGLLVDVALIAFLFVNRGSGWIRMPA
jgi:hypothetical protein